VTVSPDQPQPATALAALAISIVILVMAGLWWGLWVLVLLPVLAAYVVNVALGGRLNDSPLDVVTRWERWDQNRNRRP
jgi:cell division protein FtsW (lipid II flippase)